MNMDVNELRRLLATGAISEEDLSQMNMSGSSQPNELSRMLMPQPYAADDPAANIPTGSMRNNSTGKMTYFRPPGGDPGFSDSPYPQGQPQAQQNDMQPAPQAQAPQMMKVVGVGNGSRVSLSPEPATPVALDYSRPGIDIPGVGKGIYGKDGNAYVRNPDGSMTKAILGYDMQGSMALNKAEQARRKGEADIAHTQETTRASQVNNPDFMAGGGAGGGGVPGANGVTGEAALQGLDAGTAGLVKSLAEGRMAFPGGMAMRSPRMMQLLNLVSTYDPTFDATDFNARNKTLQGFTAGKQGDAVRAVNQAIAHAGSLSESIAKLDNFNGMMTPLNAPVNFLQQATGDSRQGQFKQNAVALASELRKVFAGSGGGSLTELQSWESGLPLNASKEQQDAYLHKGLELLQGAIGALNDQYTRGMGPRANVMDIISPKAKTTLDKLMGGGKPEQVADAGSLVVKAPDGSTHRFPNQAAANAFKQAIGQ